MSSSRYYVVGNHEVWVVQFKAREHNRNGNRREAIEFAIGAAQELGMQGECAHVCMLDDDGRLQCKWAYDPDIARTSIRDR
jgi:hypothetical protein